MRAVRAILIVGGLWVGTASAAHAAPIIGGTQTTVGQYPNVVGIEVGNGLCTGTLIRPDWVLTAAHCVTPAIVGEPNQAAVTASIKVHFKTVNILQNQGTVVRASDSLADPQFSANALGSHDIGLIKLQTPVTDTEPARVNLYSPSAPVGVTVTMVGFGATQRNSGGSVGIEFELKNRTSEACGTIDDSLTDANLLCFDQSDNKGKCEGDSGGPSFAMIGGVQMIVGVTSFGDNTCSLFGADTRTDAEKDWLVANIPELECSTDADCPENHECFDKRCIVTPFQPTGLGADCTTNADCESNFCAPQADGMKCTQYCTTGDDTTCPSGLACASDGGSGTAPHSICVSNGDGGDGGGCCDSGGAGGPATMMLGIAAVALGLSRRRRC